jgi:hypothetical protein
MWCAGALLRLSCGIIKRSSCDHRHRYGCSPDWRFDSRDAVSSGLVRALDLTAKLKLHSPLQGLSMILGVQ